MNERINFVNYQPFVNFSLQNPFNNKTHSFVHKAMYIIIREYSPIKLQQHKQNLYIWYNYRGAQYRQLMTSNSTIRAASDGALETCRPLDIQQFNFFSSLQSCNKSDVDFVRFPFQTYLCYVVSFSRNNFRVALCPPHTTPWHRHSIQQPLLFTFERCANYKIMMSPL